MRFYLSILFFVGLFFFIPVLAIQAETFSPDQEQYVSFLLPMIHEANTRILLQRKELLAAHQWLLMRQSLTQKQKIWIENLAKEYRVENFNLANAQDWKTLIKRVDIIPPSLALAQSIIESNWGKSRFAKEGNNLYGMWCYTKGCGLIPAQRLSGLTFEVKTYETPLDSVCHYVYNLDTGGAYKTFRQLRYQERCKQQILSGIELTKGMNLYAQNREAYVKRLESVI